MGILSSLRSVIDCIIKTWMKRIGCQINKSVLLFGFSFCHAVERMNNVCVRGLYLFLSSLYSSWPGNLHKSAAWDESLKISRILLQAAWEIGGLDGLGVWSLITKIMINRLLFMRWSMIRTCSAITGYKLYRGQIIFLCNGSLVRSKVICQIRKEWSISQALEGVSQHSKVRNIPW